jgi:UbiD family decarboxylase
VNLEDLHIYAMRLGKEVIDVGLVNPEYELTRLSSRRRESVLLAKLKNRGDYPVYSNLFTSRIDFAKLLSVGGIEDVYNKVEGFSVRSSLLETVSFWDFFESVSVDLGALPFIKYYVEDGGYYLTSSIYIACFEKICNASYHRTMYLSRETATLRIVPRHLHYIYSKYSEKGLDTPVAMVLGLDPVLELAASLSPPLGVFEVEVGASLGGEHRVVKTPRYGIPIPASASVVIEGVLSRDKKSREGPFTDILLLPDIEREQPVFIAEEMYVSKRRTPIIHAIVPGLWEHLLLMGLPREARMYTDLKRAVPCVKTVRLTEGGSMWLHAIVSISRSCSEGDARLAGIVAISAHPSVKHVVVVDEDINVDDPLMVEWAIATRVKSSEDVIVLKNIRGSTLDPRSSNGVGDKLVLIAITPRNEPYEKYRRVGVP